MIKKIARPRKRGTSNKSNKGIDVAKTPSSVLNNLGSIDGRSLDILDKATKQFVSSTTRQNLPVCSSAEGLTPLKGAQALQPGSKVPLKAKNHSIGTNDDQAEARRDKLSPIKVYSDIEKASAAAAKFTTLKVADNSSSS